MRFEQINQKTNEEPGNEESSVEQINQINQERKVFDKEQDIRAEERNKYRTIGEKIFFENKVSGMDMAIEQAIKMDEEAQKLIDSDEAANFPDAIEILNKKDEFALKDKTIIKKEEFVRPKVLQFTKYLEENKFLEAFGASIISSGKFRGDQETLCIRNEAIMPLINQKLSELITNKDGKNFVEAFHYFSIIKNGINRENIAQVPDDLLKSPEIVGAVKEHLIKWMKDNPSFYAHWRDIFSPLGIISADEMNNSPEIQKILKEKLDLEKNYDLKHYIYLKDEWAEKGLVLFG